ncbi:MAG: pilus assembly PilX N-terminal domain-containing protein [bacterium]
MNYYDNQKKHTSEKRGFTLFIAMVVSALILAVGFSIGNILLKEIALGSSGKNSQVAFYAADSAAECALYWDRKNPDGTAADTSPFSTSTPVATAQTLIKCGTGITGNVNTIGQIFNFTKVTDNDANLPAALYATSTFYMLFKDVSADPSIVSCGKVTVAKSTFTTTIDARGYNVDYNQAAGQCDTSNSRTIERGLRVEY